MYVTHAPCPVCAKCIINAGIDEVYYEKNYITLEGVNILKEAGIPTKPV